MARKAPHFAQNAILRPGHKAKSFRNLDAAREWLKQDGGGTIKKRNAHRGVIRCFDVAVPYRAWGVIETVSPR